MAKITARWIEFDENTLIKINDKLYVKINDNGLTGTDIWSAYKIKSEIDKAISGLDFQSDVLDIQFDNTLDPTASPNVGDRYIITNSSNLNSNFGTIDGLENNDIVEYTSSGWVVAYDVSTKGSGVLVWITNQNKFYRYDGVSWSEFGGVVGITAGDGLYKNGDILNVGAGDGIIVNADSITIKSDTITGGDIVPINVSSNGLGIDVNLLNGNHLNLTLIPSNYTPDSSIMEANDNNNLAAHLKGIDNKIYDLIINTLQLDQTSPQTIENGIPLIAQNISDYDSAKQITTKEYVDTALSVVSPFRFYLSNDDDTTGYKKAYLNSPVATETTMSFSSISGRQFLVGFITDTLDGLTQINAGVFNLLIDAQQTSMAAKDLYLDYELYGYDGSTETLLFSSDTSNEIPDTRVSISIPATVLNTINLSSYTSLIVKIYANAGTNTIDLDLFVGGNNSIYFAIAGDVYDTQFARKDLSNVSDNDVSNKVSVNNIQELISLSPEDGQKVFVAGYHSKGDGGGGVFYWNANEDTANHNGGTIIDPTRAFPADWSDIAQQATWFTANSGGTGCWKRIYNIISVKHFGAKGDGVVNDTTPIKKVISLVGSVFKQIYFPKGIYIISSKITKNINSSTNGFALIGDKDAVISSLVIGDTTFELLNAINVTINGLTFEGNGETGSSGNGHAIAFKDSAFDSGTWFPQHCDVRNVVIKNFRGTDITDLGDTVNACAIYVSNGLANHFDKIRISDCGHGLYFEKSQNTSITRCVIDGADIRGIVLNQCSNGVYITNNDIINCGTSLGVYADDDGNPYGGIFVYACNNNVGIKSTKLKNNVSNVVSYYSDEITIDDCYLRPTDKNNNGQASVWGKKTRKMNIMNGYTECVNAEGANYDGIYFLSGNNIGEYSVNILNHYISPSETLDYGVYIDGNGYPVALNIQGLTVGNATRAGGYTVSNCVYLTHGTFYGGIKGCTWVAGESNGDIGTIINTVTCDSTANIRNMEIYNNVDRTYSSGIITNTSKVTFEEGAYNGDVDANGILTVNHNLFDTPTSVIAIPQSSSAKIATIYSVSSTNFKVRFFDASGGALAEGTNTTIRYIAHM